MIVSDVLIGSVIILGGYQEKEKEFLEKIKDTLEKDYKMDSFLIIDVERFITEKDSKIARLITPRRKLFYLLSRCKFVIVDNRGRSGHLLEMEICRNCGVPTAMVQSKDSSWVTSCYDVHSSDFHRFDYNASETIKSLLGRINDWCGEREKEIEEKMGA